MLADGSFATVRRFGETISDGIRKDAEHQILNLILTSESAIMKTSVALHLLVSVAAFSVLQSCSAGGPPTPEVLTLEEGTWTGTATPPEGGTFDISFEVTSEGDSLSITIVSDFGNFELNDVQVAPDRLTFWLEIGGTRLDCELLLGEGGSYAGDCVDSDGDTGLLTMTPPKEM